MARPSWPEHAGGDRDPQLVVEEAGRPSDREDPARVQLGDVAQGPVVLDRQINARALPVLTEETVAAQSADIDTVSGATVTSDGYRESLQVAFDAAHLS